MIILAVFGLIMLAVIFVLNLIYMRTNDYYEKYGKYVEQYKGITGKEDIYAIGSAQGYYAYDFRGQGVSFANLSGNPQSLNNSRNIIQQYLNNLHENSIVLISLPLVCFFLKNIKRMPI